MRSACIIIAACCTAASIDASAQTYPSRPIRLIVPSAPGGSPDISSRLIATELTRQMGQQVLVDNRPGASGLLGIDMMAKAQADGHTLGLVTFFISTSPSLVKKLPFDAMRDFQWVVHQTTVPNVVTVQNALPITSTASLIEYAKANPGKIAFGSVGEGTSMHLSMELFQNMTGTKMLHVPYKAIQMAITDVVSGQLQLVSDNIASVLPHVKSNRVRALGVTTLKRSPAAPDLPAIAETVPGYEIAPWGGYVVPARVPRDIVLRLNAEINKALKAPPVYDRLTSLGSNIIGGTPEQFAEHVKREIAKWAGVIKAAGIEPR